MNTTLDSPVSTIVPVSAPKVVAHARTGEESLRACREFAAAFGALREFGATPATTEGLDQRDGIYHSAAENIDRGDFVGESRALSGGHFKVAGDATRIASVGKCEIFLGGGDGRVLYLGFVLQNPKRRDVVLDLLKTGQHRLTIVGDGLIVRSDGLV